MTHAAASRRGFGEPPVLAPVPRPLRAALARLLNRCVDESTPAKDLLLELEGASLALRIDGIGAQCVLIARSGAFSVEASVEAPTAELRATPLDMLALARGGGVSGLRRTGAELTGDLPTAEQFAEVLRLSRPDLEEELARWIGDLAAHEIGRAGRALVGWLRRAGEALTLNAAEYLQEESRALPAALEAEAFFSDVERLRDDVERAAARLTRLEQLRTAECAVSDSSSGS
jgi:ubiquinone biosynthesis protein UbiJ